MSEELVITEERTELVVVAPIEEEFIIHEPATVQMLEVVEQGPEGPPGPSGSGSILTWMGL